MRSKESAAHAAAVAFAPISTALAVKVESVVDSGFLIAITMLLIIASVMLFRTAELEKKNDVLHRKNPPTLPAPDPYDEFYWRGVLIDASRRDELYEAFQSLYEPGHEVNDALRLRMAIKLGGEQIPRAVLKIITTGYIETRHFPDGSFIYKSQLDALMEESRG